MYFYHFSKVLALALLVSSALGGKESRQHKEITDADVDHLLSQWQPEMVTSADILASNITKTVHSVRFLIPNVELYNKSLAGKMKDYVSLTYTDPTLYAFKAELKDQLHQAVKEIHEETNLLKRDGNLTSLEKRSMRRQHRKMAKKIARRISNRYGSHMKRSFQDWKKWHGDHLFLSEYSKL